MAVNLSFIGGAGWQFFDDNGDPLSGGKIYTYAAGTTTPQTTYTSRDGMTPNANPIILDAAGRTPQQVWATEGLLYKYVVKTSADVLVRSWDNVGGSVVASDLAQDLANTSVNTKGDALIGFRQSNAAGFLTGAVGRTVNDKFQEIVSVLDFGADPTGVSDSSAAIQAAINALKPINGLFPEKGGTVYFPPGTYLVNTAINTYSAIVLQGSGASTIMQAGASLTGAIFQPASVDVNDIYIYGIIQSFRFNTSGSVWAIKSTANNVLSSQFRDLVFVATYGISLCRPNTYAQSNYISEITSYGPVQQILALTGNFNRIESVTKEGNSGTSTEAYVYVFGADGSNVPNVGFAGGNIFKRVLIEADGSVNKTAIKFSYSTDNELENFWAELFDTNGYIVELDNSSVRIRGLCRGEALVRGKIKLRNKSWLYIDNFNANTEDISWQSYFDYDASSFTYIEHLLTRRAMDVYKLSASSNITVQQNLIYLWNQNPPTGYSAQFTADYTSGQNLLVNPSFEAGMYRWGISSADTPTFTNSEVGQGLMFQCVSTAGFQLTQSVVINASQIGQPLTIRYIAKIVGAGYAIPIVAGEADFNMHRVTAGQGWVTVTLTYRPTASGTLNFGLWWVGVGGTSSTIYVDEFSLCAGERGLLNPAKFGSFELEQRTFTAATAAPTTGTWKRGDRVFNSTPTVGQPKSWVCTVAGSPGTWVSEGNL